MAALLSTVGLDWWVDGRTALIFTDVKLDDAMFLWSFFLANLHRKEEIRINVCVCGVKNKGKAAALVKDLFVVAKRLVPGPTSLALYAVHDSKEEKRYEEATFGWCEPLLVSSGPPPKAQLVVVIGPYFKGMSNLSELDLLVPEDGGVLVFQVGYNTKYEDEARAWAYLEQRATIVLVSNRFSFDGFPNVDANHDLARALKETDPIWEKLVAAGEADSRLFSLDQTLNFWYDNPPQQAKDIVKSSNLQFAKDRPAMKKALVELLETDKQKVLALVDALKLSTTGDLEYLRRGRDNLSRDAPRLEITDAQHIISVLQIEQPVLEPCVPPTTDIDCSPAIDASNFFAVKHVKVEDSLDWMARSFHVQAFDSPFFPKSQSVTSTIGSCCTNT